MRRALVTFALLAGCSSSGNVASTDAAIGGGDRIDSALDSSLNPALDAGPAGDACDATSPSDAACPGLATACPCGCWGLDVQLLDAARACVGPRGTTFMCLRTDTAMGAEGCFVWLASGEVYLTRASPAEALPAGWRTCTAPERARYEPSPPTCGAASADAGSNTDACDAAWAGPTDAACPAFADTCPCGCMANAAYRWDPIRKCKQPAVASFCSNDGFATAATCQVRISTGDVYWTADTPKPAPDWRACTADETAGMSVWPPPPTCP